MKLIIAEKPSVAQAIANVLGATSKQDGYIEGNGYIVSWCMGHLISLASTETYDEKYKKWELNHLPIIPQSFKYGVSKGKEKQVATLWKLLKQNDVECVINACDAGREGELIFRLVYNSAKINKPIKRLWISSMEDISIKNGFANLKDGKEYENLYQSALCRSQADWIIGINATRLFSCLYNQQLNVGRVMSPTLAMIVERNANISAFVSEPFYNVILENKEIIFTSEKITEKAKADELMKVVSTQPLVVETVENKEKVEKPPKLYDLTTLQREANRNLGFTASQTLEYTQSLYEKKLCTYPRTDSRFLTEDMESGLPSIVEITLQALKLNNADNPCNKRLVIDSSKVTDHHAIIPTKTIQNFDIENLPYGEKSVLTLIMLRLICAVGDNHKYSETVVTARCGDCVFNTKGKTIIVDGFKQYARLLKADTQDKDTTLPPKVEGEVIENMVAKMKEGKTSPPKHYTEDTLLSAMETAGQNEDVEKEFCGLGTPATRAGVLEKLVSINLLERKGDKKTKYLIPTDKGISLITILPEVIQSPLMTAEWEEKLKNIEHGKILYTDFMLEITTLTKELISTYEVVKGSEQLFPSRYKSIGNCPRCGKDVVDMTKSYSCSDGSCGFVLWKDNKFFTLKKKTITKKIAEDLLKSGYTKMTGCYSEKSGKTYDCTIILDDTGGKYVNFKMEF